MIGRLLSSFFMGFLFVGVLNFLFFVGLKLNYFDLYNIDVFFNVMFVDNQNFFILLPLSLLLGYLLMHSPFKTISMKIYIVSILVFMTTFYEPIGKSIGEAIFLEENQNFKYGSSTFSGATLYKGRDDIFIYREELGKTIKLPISETTVF